MEVKVVPLSAPRAPSSAGPCILSKLYRRPIFSRRKVKRNPKRSLTKVVLFFVCVLLLLLLFRRRLSHQTSYVEMEDYSVTPFCKHRDEGISGEKIPYFFFKDTKLYLVRCRPRSEEVCLPPHETSVMIDNKLHEVCNKDEGVFCFQKHTTIDVKYNCIRNCSPGPTSITKKVTLRTGCECSQIRDTRRR